MEFTVSKVELNRRKKAFATLLVSLAIGIFLFSKLFNFSVAPVGFLFVGVVFIIIDVITFQFLSSLSRMKIRILDQEIERQKGTDIEEYQISEIGSLKIKRRTNGVIREIYISFRNHKRLYLNAFEEQFETLKDALVGKLNNKILVKEIREPLNFDHFLFYPILGLLISCASIFIFKQILKADYSVIRTFLLFFSAYTFCLAIYFISKKPISVGSGRDQIVADYIFGIGLVFISVLMTVIWSQL
jgi:hypothetical protein